MGTSISSYLEGDKQPWEEAPKGTPPTESNRYSRRHLFMKQRKSTIGPENLLLTQPRKKVLSGNKLTWDGTELPWPSKNYGRSNSVEVERMWRLKCLSHEHEDLSSVPSLNVGSQVTCTCNPDTKGTDRGWSLGLTGQSRWSSSKTDGYDKRLGRAATLWDILSDTHSWPGESKEKQTRMWGQAPARSS